MFFVSDIFEILDDLLYSSWLIALCFGVTIAVSFNKKYYFIQQIVSVLYVFGTFLLFKLLEKYDNDWSVFFDYYLINIVFVLIFLLSRTYVIATLSVIFLFYNLNRLFLVTDTYFFYFQIISIFYILYLCNVFTISSLRLLGGQLEKYNGLLLGLIVSVFMTLYQMNDIASLLDLSSINMWLNVFTGLICTLAIFPLLYKSIIKNPYLYKLKYPILLLSVFCLLISCFNLFILFSILVVLLSYCYNFTTGVVVGIASLFFTLLYTFFSKDAHLLFTIIVLLTVGLSLLLLYFRIKKNSYEEY